MCEAVLVGMSRRKFNEKINDPWQPRNLPNSDIFSNLRSSCKGVGHSTSISPLTRPPNNPPIWRFPRTFGFLQQWFPCRSVGGNMFYGGSPVPVPQTHAAQDDHRHETQHNDPAHPVGELHPPATTKRASAATPIIAQSKHS